MSKPAPLIVAHLLLMLLLSGCCHEISRQRLNAYPPLPAADSIIGTCADLATKDSADSHASLWQLLTGRSEESHYFQNVQVRIQIRNDHTLAVARLVDGIETDRERLTFKFTDGRIQFSRPYFWSNIAITSIGCEEIAIGTRPSDGSLAVYHDSSVVALLCLVLPIPADPIAGWAFFPKAERLSANTTPIPSRVALP